MKEHAAIEVGAITKDDLRRARRERASATAQFGPIKTCHRWRPR